MSKQVKYQVIIKFLWANVEDALGKKDVPRYLGKGAIDKITFFKKKIVMEMIRSKEYNAEDILSNANNTINSQIIKSLMLYYANAKSFPKIKSIECNILTPNPSAIFNLGIDEISQQFNIRLVRPEGMCFIPNEDMYKESSLGNAERRALSHWLKAMNTTDSYVKFNELWIAFNSLFAYYGNRKQERNNLIYIRQQIQNNANLFTKTQALVNTYNEDKLRNSFRWMLLFSKGINRGIETFCESLFAFRDERVLQMFNSLISSGRIHSKVIQFSRYGALQAHLNTKGIVEDIDVALLLCIKYAYFLRNRYQHGIVIANNFKIKDTKDDIELPTINLLLSTLILELFHVGNQIPCQL